MYNSKTKGYFTIQERVENFRLFYKRQNERPLFGFFVGSEYPLKRYNAAKNLPEGRELCPDDFDISLYLDDCDRLFDEHEQCGGDFIWSASAFWGIPWLEAALGCNIFADHKTGSIHSEPPSKFTGAKDIPDFDESSPWINKTKEFLEAMAKRSSGRWPLATTRMRGISDLLSALYEGEKFIYAMMEEPEEVMAVCEKLTDFWIAYGKIQLAHIPAFHGGVGSFYYNMWAPEGTIWHQEDAAALLSPSLFNKFIYPCDEKIVKSFKGCIMHQHPTRYVPAEEYIKMGMLALELHIDEGGSSAQELYNTHLKILEKKPLLIWGSIPEKGLDWIFSKLPHEGLAVNTVVSDYKQAHYLWDKYF